MAHRPALPVLRPESPVNRPASPAHRPGSPILRPSDADAAEYLYQIIPGAMGNWRSDDENIVLNGSTVSSWPGLVGTEGSLAQATAADQPAYSASDASWSGIPSLTFDGTSDGLVSTLAASSWAFLHDGTGATTILVCRPTDSIRADNEVLSTNNDGFGVGYCLRHSGTNNRFRYQVKDGVGPNIIDINVGAASPENTNYGPLTTFGGTTGELRNPVDTVIGSGTGTPVGTNPATTLWVGRRAAGGLLFEGSIVELALWPFVFDAAQRASASAYLAARYGL